MSTTRPQFSLETKRAFAPLAADKMKQSFNWKPVNHCWWGKANENVELLPLFMCLSRCACCCTRNAIFFQPLPTDKVFGRKFSLVKVGEFRHVAGRLRATCLWPLAWTRERKYLRLVWASLKGNAMQGLRFVNLRDCWEKVSRRSSESNWQRRLKDSWFWFSRLAGEFWLVLLSLRVMRN